MGRTQTQYIQIWTKISLQAQSKIFIYDKSYKTSQIKLNTFTKQNNYEACKLHPTSKALISYTDIKG